MKLMEKLKQEYNNDLRTKVYSIIESLSITFLSLVGDKIIRKTHDDDWSIEEQYLAKNAGNDKIDQFLLRIALKEDYSKAKKEDTLEVFKSAVTTFVTCRNIALTDIKNNEYPQAMDMIIIMSEALGCLKAQNALIKIKGYFDKERKNKQNAANAKHPNRDKICNIILECASKRAGTHRSISKLVDDIETECIDLIRTRLGDNAIEWKDENFAKVVERIRRNDPDFDMKFKSFLSKKQ